MEIDIPVFIDATSTGSEVNWFAKHTADPPVTLITGPPTESISSPSQWGVTRRFLENPQLSLSTWEAALQKIWNFPSTAHRAAIVLGYTLTWMRPKDMDDTLRKLSLLETTFAKREFQQQTVDEVKRDLLRLATLQQTRLECLSDEYDAMSFLRVFQESYKSMELFPKVFPVLAPAILYSVVSTAAISQAQTKEFPDYHHELCLEVLQLYKETGLALNFPQQLINHLIALTPEQAQKTDRLITSFKEINPTLFFDLSPYLWYHHNLKTNFPLLWKRLEEEYRKHVMPAGVGDRIKFILSPLCDVHSLRHSSFSLQELAAKSWLNWDWWKRFDGMYGQIIGELAQTVPQDTRVYAVFDMAEQL